MSRLTRQDRGCQPYEIPKNIFLTATKFTVENGMLTPSMKLRRTGIKKAFAAEIEKLWVIDNTLEQEVFCSS